MDQKTKKQATIALKRTFSDLLRENQPANFWGQSFSAWLDAATDEQNALPWNEVSAPNAKYVSRKDVSCALDATGVDEIGNDFFTPIHFYLLALIFPAVAQFFFLLSTLMTMSALCG